MRRICIVVALLVVGVSVAGQGFIRQKKQKAFQYLVDFSAGNNMKGRIIDEDSVLFFFNRDSVTTSFDLVLGFDEDGKCVYEKRTWGCDSCFQKSLKQLLATKKYHWEKLQDGNYVSSYFWRLFIELNNQPPFTYVVRRIPSDHKTYRNLTAVH